MNKNEVIRILVSAGGTGGHLFPALHVARAVRNINPNIEVQFIGSGRPLEKQIVDAEGFKRHEVAIVGLKRRGIAGLFQFLTLLPSAIKQVWAVLREFRPDVVAGFGGYPTVLPVFLARLRNVPTWIHESELRPGLANWALAPFADKISLAFYGAKVPFRWKHVHSGQPVRQGLCEAGQANLPEGRPFRLLILGGSQGANSLDQAIAELAPFLSEQGIEIWHQARSGNVEFLTQRLSQAGVKATVVPFVVEPVEAYAWCHAVISRSGASSVMELEALNKPAIFVPYPFSQGGHQIANARTLTEAGKALLVEEGEGFVERLRAAILAVLNREQYYQMRKRVTSTRSLSAAGTIAQGLIALASARKAPPKNTGLSG